MSDTNDLYPTLPGLKFGTVRSPVWKTKILTTASDREQRGQFVSYPRWKFALSYEFLRGASWDEFGSLVGFFNDHGGSADTWLFRDPTGYEVVNQACGIGDGSNAEFRLVRAFGGFVEPILAPEYAGIYLDRGNPGKWRVGGASRTNYFARTEDMTSTYWSKTGVTVTANAATNRDGNTTADLLTEDTSNTSHRIWRSMTPQGANVRHCISMRVRSSGRTAFAMSMPWAGAGAANFDLVAETSSVRSGTVEATGIRNLGGGWFRIWFVVRPSDAASGTFAAYILASPNGAVTYTGDGASGMYYDALQMETLTEDDPPEPTQYIPNSSGTAFTVPADYTMSDYGYFNFATPPDSGVEVSWTGTFFRRCRFLHDVLDVEEFMRDLYSAKKVEFISIK
jgi:hypothetical protein